MTGTLLNRLVQGLFQQVCAGHFFEHRISGSGLCGRANSSLRSLISIPKHRTKIYLGTPAKAISFWRLDTVLAPLRHADWRALFGAPIGALPRNRLAASATGGASAVSSDKKEKNGVETRPPLPLGAKELAPQGESPAPRAEARNTPFTILPKSAKNRLPHLREAAMMDNSL